jgi:O-antigen/teichoic acid export membrane protein
MVNRFILAFKERWNSANGSLQLSQLLRAGIIFIMTILTARLCSTKLEMSKIETIILTFSSLSFFWVSGFINTYLPEQKRNPESADNALKNLLFIFGICGALVAQIVLYPLIKGNSYLIFPTFLLYQLSFSIDYFLFAKGRLKLLKEYAISNFIISILVFFIVLKQYPNVEGFLYGLFGVSFLRIIFYLITIKLPFDLKSRALHDSILFFKRSWTYLLVMLLNGIFLYSDSWIVKSFCLPSVFLIYRYGGREIPIVQILSNATSNHQSRVVISKDNEIIKKELVQENIRLQWLCFPLAIIFCLFSSNLFKFLYGNVLLDAAPIFSIYTLTTIPRMIQPQGILLGLGHQNAMLRISAIEVLFNIAADFILLYFFGIYGIAFASFLAYSLEKLLQVYYLNKHEQIELSQYVQIKLFMVFSICLVVGLVLRLSVFR